MVPRCTALEGRQHRSLGVWPELGIAYQPRLEHRNSSSAEAKRMMLGALVRRIALARAGNRGEAAGGEGEARVFDGNAFAALTIKAKSSRMSATSRDLPSGRVAQVKSLGGEHPVKSSRQDLRQVTCLELKANPDASLWTQISSKPGVGQSPGADVSGA